MQIGRDADYSSARSVARTEDDALRQRILIRPQHVRHGFVEDDDGLAPFAIAREKRASPMNRRPHRCEIVAVDGRHTRTVARNGGNRVATGNPSADGHPLEEGNTDGERRSFHASHASYRVDQRPMSKSIHEAHTLAPLSE